MDLRRTLLLLLPDYDLYYYQLGAFIFVLVAEFAEPRPHIDVKRKATFCEQKVAKKLFQLGRAGDTDTGPKSKTFFAPLFFKKAAA